MFCIQISGSESGKLITFGPLFGHFLGTIWCRSNGKRGPGPGPPKKGFFTEIVVNRPAYFSISSKNDIFWSKLIKTDQKLCPKTGFFHFRRFWPKSTKMTGPDQNPWVLVFKSVIWGHPKKGGVDQLLYYFDFWRGQKSIQKISKKWVNFGAFWHCPKTGDFIGSGTIGFSTFWPKHVPTFWTKNWSIFGTAQKVRFYD